MILSPLTLLSGHSRSQETKWCSVCHLLIHDIDAINLSQVRTGHAKQLGTQVELRRIPFLFLEPLLPFLFRQTGTLAPILSLLEILLKPPIALGHLLLAKLVTILFLFQHKQQIFLPVALQTPRELLLSRLHPPITEGSQFMGIAFACQNGLDDRLSSHSAQITQHISQLEIHLRQRRPKGIPQQPIRVQLHQPLTLLCVTFAPR